MFKPSKSWVMVKGDVNCEFPFDSSGHLSLRCSDVPAECARDPVNPLA